MENTSSIFKNQSFMNDYGNFTLNISTHSATSTARINVLIAVVTWFTVASFFGSLFGNMLFLLVYIKHRRLQTPFNSYIANLCFLEILLTITAMPGNFISNWLQYWPLGSFACGALFYCNNVIGSAVRHAHLLVSFNRLWAVTFPITYKSFHTNVFAYCLIILTFIYVNAVQVTVIVYGRRGADPNAQLCNLSTSGIYVFSLIAQVLGFLMPEMLIMFMAPYIVYKIHKRQFKRKSRVGIFTVSRVVTLAVSATHRSENNNTSEAEVESREAGAPRAAHDRRNIAHDRVLFYLVAAIIICWTPNHVFFTLQKTRNYWNQTYYAVQYCVFYANSWINPILCYIALDAFRAKINDLLCCRSRRIRNRKFVP